jgi:hypothetical protein
MPSLADPLRRVEYFTQVPELSWFREDFYDCLTVRRDGLFELVDALLCQAGPVKSLVELSLAAEHRRGHGALYDAVNAGRLDVARLSMIVAGLPVAKMAGGRIVPAVDVSNWLRPDAATSPDRLFCHVHGRGRNAAQIIPGWPYSVVAALEPGRTSWTALLDAQRLGPADDAAKVTAEQLRRVVQRLIAAGHWQEGGPRILIVADAGYDLPRLAFALADLPVDVVGRVRSDRVFAFPPPARIPGRVGRPAFHGAAFDLDDPATYPEPHAETVTDTTRYGKAEAAAWDRLHPRLTRRSCWIEHEGDLPIIEGTVIRLKVDHLPGDRAPKPVWLWASVIDIEAAEVDRLWQAYLRRFDLEHTFRLFKQVLGWNRPKLRSPWAADRWTWLVIAAHTQLRLARQLVTDLRLPWEKPAEPGRMTPARVRRGFRNISPTLPHPAGAPKPTIPGPGRPPGSRNHHPATHHDVGKTVKRPATLTELKSP